MKKLLLLSAVLFGATAASQAGVHLNFGFSLPLPPLPRVVVSAPAPVYYQAPAAAYCPPPVCYSAPPVVYLRPPSLYFGFGGYRSYGGWDRGYAYRGYGGYSHGHGGHHGR